MKAIDTNVAARFLLNDDPVQTERARRVLEQPIFIPTTVLLELGWLLTSRYGQRRDVVSEALMQLIDLPDVVVLDAERVRWALARHADRGDFADLIHLTATAYADAFVTFDRSLAAAAGPDSPVPVETLD